MDITKDTTTLYASDRDVFLFLVDDVDAAVRVEDNILEMYLGPNRTLQELREFAHKGRMNFLTEFSEACREDLAVRVR